MKNKFLKGRGDYRQLRNKIFIRTLIMVFASIVILFLLYDLLLHGRFANWMVAFFQNAFHTDFATALHLYQQSFRDYMLSLIHISEPTRP